MRVALHNVDSKIPNLALMKLSTYHKAAGDVVDWYLPLESGMYEVVYASKMFDSSRLDVSGNVVVGGPAGDVKSLPDDVDRCSPDYSIYPGYQHNIGFTSRGCRFNCSFCKVPSLEGKIRSVTTVPEIVTNKSDFLILLDNDFFGQPQWKERAAEMVEMKLRVNISQGINVRTITEEQAAALVRIDFRNISGKHRQIHFAWDNVNDEEVVRRGIARLVKAGVKPWHMNCYVLIGFNSTHEEDLYRVRELHGLGITPFAMPYDRSDSYQRDFTRWVNAYIFKTVPFDQYNRVVV